MWGEPLVGGGPFTQSKEAREIGRPGAENSAPGRLPAQSRLAGLARLLGLRGRLWVCAEWRARPGGGGWGATGPQRLLLATASVLGPSGPGRAGGRR